MKKIINILFVVLLLVSCTSKSQISTDSTTTDEIQTNTVSIASYNMLRLGTNNHKDYEKLASVVENFDVVGSIEVIKETGMQETMKYLPTTWKYVISEKNVGTTSYKEYFGYFYDDKIELVQPLGFYPINEEFERPPYGAQFKIKNSDFTFNVIIAHIVFGDSIQERISEINNLGKVYEYFENKTGNKKITIICGDFNLENIKEFDELINMGNVNLDSVKKTTLGKKGPSSDYDHMFMSSNLSKNVVECDVLYWTDDWENSRKYVSDHFPIYVKMRY